MAKNYTQLKQKESALSPGLFKESKPYSFVLCCINNNHTRLKPLNGHTRHPWVTKTWAYTSLHGVLGGLINGEAYMPEGLYTTCNWTRKSASEQATAVLIKTCFAFTGFL